jgi:hypothetical protein
MTMVKMEKNWQAEKTMIEEESISTKSKTWS